MIGATLSAVQCILLVYVASFLFQRAGSALLFYVIGLLVVRVLRAVSLINVIISKAADWRRFVRRSSSSYRIRPWSPCSCRLWCTWCSGRSTCSSPVTQTSAPRAAPCLRLRSSRQESGARLPFRRYRLASTCLPYTKWAAIEYMYEWSFGCKEAYSLCRHFVLLPSSFCRHTISSPLLFKSKGSVTLATHTRNPCPHYSNVEDTRYIILCRTSRQCLAELSLTQGTLLLSTTRLWALISSATSLTFASVTFSGRSLRCVQQSISSVVLLFITCIFEEINYYWLLCILTNVFLSQMGAHIIIFLSLLFILHDRTYFGYRPFFWCCTKPEDVSDPETAENPEFVPDYQLSNGHTDSRNETPTGEQTVGAPNDDVLQERSYVYQSVSRMTTHARSLGSTDSSVRFFNSMHTSNLQEVHFSFYTL